jgi:hypothetical protein
VHDRAAAATGALRELRRVLRPEGDLGLLVFVARGPLPGPLPEGNDFPTEEALLELLDETGSAWSRAWSPMGSRRLR